MLYAFFLKKIICCCCYQHFTPAVAGKTWFPFLVMFSFAASSHSSSLSFTNAVLQSFWPFFFNTLLSLLSSFSREYEFLPSPLQSWCHISSDYMIHLEATTDTRSHHTTLIQSVSQSPFMPPLLLFYTVTIYLVSHKDVWPKLIAKGLICHLLTERQRETHTGFSRLWIRP